MTAELAERARQQAARAKPGQGAPKGRPRCGASWTAAAAGTLQKPAEERRAPRNSAASSV